jgi:hypothetical protein
MNGDQIGGILRAVLAALGGILVTKGYVDDATVQTIVGGVVSVAVAVWSVASNKTGKTIGTKAGE